MIGSQLIQILKKILIFTLFFNVYVVFCQNSALYDKVISLSNAVEDPDRQVGNFDPTNSPSLPIGLVKEINGNRYIIAIDSAYFLGDAAYFSAYMAIDFPNSNKKIAFAAKNIQFNPKGVVGGNQAKLMLVSDHIIDLGPNTRLALKGDGSNYVNWNCNGFESVNLKGAFLFSGNILQPANADTCVSATFETNVTDIHNMMASVSVSPFTIAGLSDFDFSVSSAYADMSDFVNPLGVAMPSCYSDIYEDDIQLWRGFYLKNFTVTLPPNLSAGDARTQLFARDLFIDEAGATGYFGAANVLSLRDGKTDGNWGFSIDSLEIGLTTNAISSGLMKGSVEVPLLDNNALIYSALISKNNTTRKASYHFTVQTEESVEVSCFNSTLELYPTSRLSMSVVNNKFKPQMVLNGKWTLERPNASFKGIGFQTVTLITESPYLSAGIFSLISDEPPKTAKFPVSINELSLGIYQSKPVIQALVGINFGQEGDANNFSAETGFRVISAVVPNEITGKQEWKFDRFSILSIDLDITTTIFTMDGLINFYEDDPVYGDGFKGELNLAVGTVIPPMGMYCVFGKMPTYKYWAVDVSVPTNIPLTALLKIDKLSGGLSYHMENTQTVDAIIAAARAPILAASPAMSPDYIPNDANGIGFRAGVGYVYTPEKVLNGEVAFSIEFNPYGGLQRILLTGDAYLMVKRNERAGATNYARGTVAIEYDNVEHILDARLAVDARFAGAFTADIWSQIYMSPDLWFFHLGTPTDQCSVSLSDFASANAYFMFGQNLPPMAPPPPQVAGVLGGMGDSRNEDAIVLGDGIGTGMNLYVGFDESLAWRDFAVYANGYLGAGFDMTLYKYDDAAYCEESGDDFGANNWYLQGQLYAYGGIGAGVAGTFLGSPFDLTIISASMAMLLEGRLPKPAYVYGGLNVSATIFDIFDVAMTVDFEAGENCTIID